MGWMRERDLEFNKKVELSTILRCKLINIDVNSKVEEAGRYKGSFQAVAWKCSDAFG